jgi:hypothetical protein
LTQVEAEATFEDRRNIAEGESGMNRGIDLIRRSVRKECTVAQMSDEEADLALPVRMIGMGCLLMIYLEPAQQQEGCRQEQVNGISQVMRRDIHGREILEKPKALIKPGMCH